MKCGAYARYLDNTLSNSHINVTTMTGSLKARRVALHHSSTPRHSPYHHQPPNTSSGSITLTINSRNAGLSDQVTLPTLHSSTSSVVSFLAWNISCRSSAFPFAISSNTASSASRTSANVGGSGRICDLEVKWSGLETYLG